MKLLLVAAALAGASSTAFAIDKDTAGSSAELTDTAAWVGGIAPGSTTVANWGASSLTGAQTLNGDVTWRNITYGNSGSTSITGTGVLNLNSAADMGVVVTAGSLNIANSINVLPNNGTTPLSVGATTNRVTFAANNSGSSLTINNVTANSASGNANISLRGNSNLINVLNGTLTVQGQVRKEDAGTWTLNGANSVGWFFFNRGTLLTGNDQAFGSTSGTNSAGSANGTIYLSGGNDLMIASKDATDRNYGNALDFTGASLADYTATITFGQTSGGTGAQTFGAVILAGVNKIATNSNTTFSGIVSGVGGINKSGTGTLTLSNANTYNGGTTVSAGTLKLGDNSALGSGSATVNSGATLDIGDHWIGNSITLAGGTLDSSGSDASLDGGAITLTANSTITTSGGDWISYFDNTVDLGGKTLTQAGKMWVDASTISVSNGTYQLNSRLDGYGSITWGADTSLSLGATGLYNVGGAGTLHNVSGVAGAVIDGGDNANTLTLNQTGSRTFAGVIQNASVTFAGTGVTTLTGANTYAGGTTINAGTVITGHTSALGTGAVAISGGTLQLGAGGVSGIASLTVNSGTLDTTGGGVTTTGAFNLLGGVWILGNTADALTATSFNLSGGQIDLLGFTSKAIAGTYSLIAGNGVSSLTSAAFINGDAAYTYSINTAGDLVVTAVPEPGTYGLIGAGALATAAAVRRRRKAKVIV